MVFYSYEHLTFTIKKFQTIEIFLKIRILRYYILYIVLALSSPRLLGQQGNYKFNNFGNRSILLSGNVTGSVSDIGLVYYNPARLNIVETNGFAFNAKAYQLNSLRLDTVLDEERQIESNSFSGVPSMAGGTFKLFGHRFAYSFISRRRTDINLGLSSRNITSNILDFFPNTENYNLNTSAKTNLREDWYGLTWAYQIAKNLSLGISLFGSSYKDSGTRRISHTIQYNSDNVAYYLTQTGFSQESYGLYFKVGGSYKLNKIDLGLNINLPYIEIIKDGSYNYNEVISGTENNTDTFYDYEFDDLNSRRKEPLGISIGAGIPLQRSKIHLNVDYVAAVSDFARLVIPNIDIGESTPTPVPFREERKAVVNFGVGGEIYISEKFMAYFGFSTDFNSYNSNSNIFDLSTNDAEDAVIAADYYHLSGGIDWKLTWAKLILGITYARGAVDFSNPFNINSSGLDFGSTQNSRLANVRYQAVVGLEIPFIKQKSNNLKSGKDSE